MWNMQLSVHNEEQMYQYGITEIDHYSLSDVRSMI